MREFADRSPLTDPEVDRDAIASMAKAGLPDAEPMRRMPGQRAAGRGAVSNPGVRFEATATEAFDDGWGTLDAFADIPVGRKILIHINNSNPLLDRTSPEYAAVRAAGWDVAFDGMKVTL